MRKLTQLRLRMNREDVDAALALLDERPINLHLVFTTLKRVSHDLALLEAELQDRMMPSRKEETRCPTQNG